MLWCRVRKPQCVFEQIVSCALRSLSPRRSFAHRHQGHSRRHCWWYWRMRCYRRVRPILGLSRMCRVCVARVGKIWIAWRLTCDCISSLPCVSEWEPPCRLRSSREVCWNRQANQSQWLTISSRFRHSPVPTHPNRAVCRGTSTWRVRKVWVESQADISVWRFSNRTQCRDRTSAIRV